MSFTEFFGLFLELQLILHANKHSYSNIKQRLYFTVKMMKAAVKMYFQICKT